MLARHIHIPKDEGMMATLLQRVVPLFAAVNCVMATMTNSWAVHMKSSGARAARGADALAKKYGFVNLGPVSVLHCNL